MASVSLLSVRKPRWKLRAVTTHAEGVLAGQEHSREFADFLAIRFPHSHIYATELPGIIEDAFHDLKQGKDSSSGCVIAHPAVHAVRSAENLIRQDIPKIISAAFPRDFAAAAMRSVQPKELKRA